MPSTKATKTGPAVAKAEDDFEVASFSSQSGDATDDASEHDGSDHDDSDEDGSEAGSDSGAESDSLDSDAPRKKRKVSIDVEVDPVDDEPYQAGIISSIQAPSRVRGKNGAKAAPKAAPPQPAGLDIGPEMTPANVPVDPNMTFESLGLRPWLVQSLSNMAIKRPTGIQRETIPEILKGRDCEFHSTMANLLLLTRPRHRRKSDWFRQVSARIFIERQSLIIVGLTGKTVAFATPILQKLAEDPSCIFAVVLTATRELALQIVRGSG